MVQGETKKDDEGVFDARLGRGAVKASAENEAEDQHVEAQHQQGIEQRPDQSEVTPLVPQLDLLW